MSEHKYPLGKMLLKIDPLGGTSYNTVVCLTSVSPDDSLDMVDASSQCGPDQLPGKATFKIAFEGQHLADPDSGKISGVDLRMLLRAKTLIGYSIVQETPTTGDEKEEGVGYISKLSSSYAFDGVATFSGEISPSGESTLTIHS